MALHPHVRRRQTLLRLICVRAYGCVRHRRAFTDLEVVGPLCAIRVPIKGRRNIARGLDPIPFRGKDWTSQRELAESRTAEGHQYERGCKDDLHTAPELVMTNYGAARILHVLAPHPAPFFLQTTRPQSEILTIRAMRSRHHIPRIDNIESSSLIWSIPFSWEVPARAFDESLAPHVGFHPSFRDCRSRRSAGRRGVNRGYGDMISITLFLGSATFLAVTERKCGRNQRNGKRGPKSKRTPR